MQKLELRQNLKNIIKQTKSLEILSFFNNQNRQNGGFTNILLTLMVQSKTGFDQAILDEKQNSIMSQFEAHKYYETKFFNEIIKFVSINNLEVANHYLQKSKQITEFFTFHNSLVTSYGLVNNLLFQNKDLQESVDMDNYDTAEANGYLSFELMSETNIDFNTYTLVVININILVKTVKEVIEKLENTTFEQNPKLILADSGSNTILSIKLPKEISKSISKIIDDAWKFLTNKTGFKMENINNNLGQSLEILSKIKQAQEDELISPEQAEIWRRNITNSTEKIIMNNTLTKSKAEEIYVISNQKMLSDATRKELPR